MIPFYQPKIRVTLKKVQRRSGADRMAHLSGTQIEPIDLTPHLGESGGVVTHRGLDQSAGTFSVTLADRMDAKNQDTIYATIEPMDMIEIRMARRQQGELPIVMRGLVSSVTRNEVIGQDGRPMRTVQIAGHDFGKFLQIMQISYLKEYVYGNIPLTAFPMFEVYGKWFGEHDASQFVEEIIGSLVRNFLGDVWLWSGLKEAPVLKTDATVRGSTIGPFGVPNYEGNIWNLLSNWCDLGWNELYIEDRPDAAYVVYRPTPYYGLDGKLIMPGAVAPDEIQVGVDECESLSLSRSDSNLANFYQVDAPAAEIIPLDWIRTAAIQDGLVLVTSNRNCQPELYGLKKMTARTMQGKKDWSYWNTLTCGPEWKPLQAAEVGTWYAQRRDELKALNVDNVVYEDGQIALRGNERIRPGVYLRLKRGTRQSRFYATHVTQQFSAYQHFKTTVQVARGESWYDRIREGGSPYALEREGGVY